MAAEILEWCRGNTDSRIITITGVAGAAFNMTNYLVRFIVKANYNIADAAASINKLVAFATPATGIGVLTLTHADLDINPRNYIYEFKLYKADGSFIQTLNNEIGIVIIKYVVLFETPNGM